MNAFDSIRTFLADDPGLDLCAACLAARTRRALPPTSIGRKFRSA